MKVGSPTNIVNFNAFVQDKLERQRREPEGQKDQRDSEKDSQDQDSEPSPERFEEQMNEAVQAFRNDPQAQASGLSAATEGSGPGLKVVLKDGSGAVVRQISGEEFLKLREAVSDQRARGKILDRKF